MDKSANQLWKESNTSLSFKDWLEREKSKGIFIPNKKFMSLGGIDLENSINNTSIKDTLNISKERFEKELGIHKKETIVPKNKVFGLNKGLLVASGFIILGAIGYKVYQNRK